MNPSIMDGSQTASDLFPFLTNPASRYEPESRPSDLECVDLTLWNEFHVWQAGIGAAIALVFAALTAYGTLNASDSLSKNPPIHNVPNGLTDDMNYLLISLVSLFFCIVSFQRRDHIYKVNEPLCLNWNSSVFASHRQFCRRHGKRMWKHFHLIFFVTTPFLLIYNQWFFGFRLL